MKKIFVLFIFIASCTEIKKNHSESNNNSEIYNRIIDSMETDDLYKKDLSEKVERIDSLRTKALKLGDTSAYYKLSGYYLFNMDNPDGLFMTSYEMATKYHYSKAYFDLFYILYINKGEKVLDNCTKNMAMFYLLLAYENNNEQSKTFVKELFGNKQIPNSESYKKEFCY